MEKKKRTPIPQQNKVRSELQREINSSCPFCESSDVGHFEIHHIDENPSNNAPINLLLLCPICHSKITKRDISKEMVMLKKIEVLSNLNATKNQKSQSISFNSKVGNAVVGDGNTVNIKNVKNGKRNYPEGSIGYDNNKSNYISYLIDRYHKFKEHEMKTRMNYAIFPSQLKKKYRIGKTRTIYHVPENKFDELAAYIQQRIEGTTLAKIKGIAHKKYSTFEEHLKKLE